MNSYVLIGGLAAGQGGAQLLRLSALRMFNRSSNLPLPSDLEPPSIDTRLRSREPCLSASSSPTWRFAERTVN